MSLIKGDLVRIPANSCLTQKQNELAMIERYTYTEKPTVGIFIRYIEHQALVYINSNYWLVGLGDARYAGGKNAS
jgi:hypothetical protein|tara:strand:- start:234 stop:458 length:225 start_codon:yes stop_codon:yes gene_type:complete